MGNCLRCWLLMEPNKFLPERFLESSINFNSTDFEFILLGAERRMCPGILFAKSNVELPLADLLFHFDRKLLDGMKLGDLNIGLTTRKVDLLPIPTPHNAFPTQ